MGRGCSMAISRCSMVRGCSTVSRCSMVRGGRVPRGDGAYALLLEVSDALRCRHVPS